MGRLDSFTYVMVVIRVQIAIGEASRVSNRLNGQSMHTSITSDTQVISQDDDGHLAVALSCQFVVYKFDYLNSTLSILGIL